MGKALNDRGARAESFNFACIFHSVLNDMGMRPSAFALELNRERSLMYKWLSGACVPQAEYFPKLVSIVSRQTSETRKRMLENHLREIVEGIPVSRDVLAKALEAKTLDELLFECFHLSTMPDAGAGPRESMARGVRWRTMALAGAFFAAIAGGILWNLLNRILGWTHYMGDTEEILRGFHALVWGVVTILPIPLLFLLLYGPGRRNRLIAPMAAFAFVGSMTGFIFHDLGIRETLEGMVPGYYLQEIIIVIVYSSILSFPPLLAASLILSRGRLLLRHALVLLAPVAGALIGVLFSFLIDKPVSEILLLRGFIVGFVMRFLIFLSLFWAYTLSSGRQPGDQSISRHNKD